MKLPIKWLREYLDFSEDPQQLIEKLTGAGHMQDGPAKEIAGDTVYDLEIRQNRPDCLSIIGLAREAAAVLGQKLKYPSAYSKKLPELKKDTQVDIEDPKLCYRFNTLTIENVKVVSSPDWLVNRLEAYGIKSINCIVDITNYVMVEVGQPLHAFDAEKVADRHLVMRIAKPKEKLTVLGGKTLALSKEDLVIADSQKVLGLAGILGGSENGVTETTTSIILEAATYNQAAIRRSSLRHQLRTEASTRLEKFLHPHLTEVALTRTIELILELCGGQVVDHTDNYPTKFKEVKIPLKIESLQKLGGVEIDQKTAHSILESLEIGETVPYFRTDLQEEADMIEEVLRIWGYDRIPSRLPGNPPMRIAQSPLYDLEEEIRDALTGFGFDEEITDPLTNEETATDAVILQNSLNTDKTMLRTTLKNNLSNALAQQKKYRKTEIKLFEIGKVYSAPNIEKRVLGLVCHGKNSYFILKGSVEALFEKLGLERNLKLNIENLGNASYFCQIEIEQSFTIRAKPSVHTSPPQLVLEDLSFFVPKECNVEEALETVRTISTAIYKVELGETPQEHGKNEKTLFIKIAYHGADVEDLHKKIIDQLAKNYQAKLR